MNETDLLIKIRNICEDSVYGTNLSKTLTKAEKLQCMQYLTSKIIRENFKRNDAEQWRQAKNVLYERLNQKSPQSMFELTLGLPDGVGVVIMDEVVYGRMYFDEYRNVGVKK
jgi:hypothetical protein